MEKQNSEDCALDGTSRHFIRVAAPTTHAGIGNALRRAFYVNGENSGLDGFEDLLKRLD